MEQKKEDSLATWNTGWCSCRDRPHRWHRHPRHDNWHPCVCGEEGEPFANAHTRHSCRVQRLSWLNQGSHMSLESLMFFNLNVATIGRKLHGFEIKCFCNVSCHASLKNSFYLSPKTRPLLLLYRSAVFLCGCILTQLGKNSNTVLSQTGDTCLNTTYALLFLIVFILLWFDAFLSHIFVT